MTRLPVLVYRKRMEPLARMITEGVDLGLVTTMVRVIYNLRPIPLLVIAPEQDTMTLTVTL